VVDTQPKIEFSLTMFTVVRLNVNSKVLESSTIFHCQFWYNEDDPPVIVETTKVLLMWSELKGDKRLLVRFTKASFISAFGADDPSVLYPYLVECPFDGPVPTSVSLVKSYCDHAENNLKILDPQPVKRVKKRFGVCTKHMEFNDSNFTVRFIEWMHLMRLLGAEKVHFAYSSFHPDMFKVVQYFVDREMLDVWPYMPPSGISDTSLYSWQEFQLEVNTLTDCFYRVKNLYDYVAILDFDEVITPVMPDDFTWEDIIKRANVLEYQDALLSQNVYYPEVNAEPFDEVPKFMYILQHVQRSQNFSEWNDAVKSFFGTERVLSLHNHSPPHCISENLECRLFEFTKEISQNSHYRSQMDEGTTFNITQEDKTLWKYKDRLIQAVNETLRDVEEQFGLKFVE
jgi:hypothetical protein